jgi:hypothetical protein
VDTALVVAGISFVAAVASAVYARRAQLDATKLQAQLARESREEERRSEAKQVLDRYRGPLMDAAWQLGNRIDNIRNRGFLTYLKPGSGREQDAKLTTLFRFAQFFGWREFVRGEVQLLRFENERDTQLVSGFLNDIAWIFSTHTLDSGRAMLWADEQRGIGELMASERPGGSGVRGHASFHKDYNEVFAPWMERLAGDVLSDQAKSSDRLRLLQWALFGLVRRLDEEGVYGPSDWMTDAERELRHETSSRSVRKQEAQLRNHLDELSRTRESAKPTVTEH